MPNPLTYTQADFVGSTPINTVNPEELNQELIAASPFTSTPAAYVRMTVDGDPIATFTVEVFFDVVPDATDEAAVDAIIAAHPATAAAKFTTSENVKDKDLTTPPGAPAMGDKYIVASVATGAWVTHETEIAEWDGSVWVFTIPVEGTIIWVDDENLLYAFDGTAWASVSSKSIEIFEHGLELSSSKDGHPGKNVTANGSLDIGWMIPDDFKDLVSLHILMSPGATNASADIDLASNYGVVGEPLNQHSETNTTIVYSLTVDITVALDVASVFSSLSPGDLCGLTLDLNAIGGTAHFIGSRLRYTR